MSDAISRQVIIIYQPVLLISLMSFTFQNIIYGISKILH